MPTDLTLYTHPQSRGRIARWMLEEIGQPYQAVVLDYATTMHAPAYLAINPLGKVPSLVHNGRIITEYAAICAYLADTFPAASLAPTPDERADYYRFLFMAAGPLEAALVNQVLAVDVPPEKRGMVGYRPVLQMLNVFEAQLIRHPYLAGDRFTAVDVSAGSQIGWGMNFGTVEKRPAFIDYWARCSVRPACQRATETDNALIQKG